MCKRCYSKTKIKKQLKRHVLLSSCLKKELREKDKQIKILKKNLNAAQEGNLRKLEFITYLTHEFKTPLSAIIGFCSLMKEKEFSKEKQTKFFNNILCASNHMLHIISNTMDMARAETGKIRLDYTEFRPQEVIEEVLGILEEKISKKHINVITNYSAVHVIADKRRFKQLVFNLAGNAVKFNKVGGTIKIRTSITDSTFRFEIEDTGIGISPNEQDKIFDFFSNLYTHKLDDDECTGVGLSLCKKIINLHDGEINFYSKVSRGSVFWFSIPLKPIIKDENFNFLQV